jgi:hypothetical protein
MPSVFPSDASPGWSAPLTRPIRVKNGPTLRSLADLRGFIIRQPPTVHERKTWQSACELLRAAAEGSGDVGAVTEKFELALFLESRWLPAHRNSFEAPARDDTGVATNTAAAVKTDHHAATEIPAVREMMDLIYALKLLHDTRSRAA